MHPALRRGGGSTMIRPCGGECVMYNILYIIGAIVVVIVVLKVLGLF